MQFEQKEFDVLGVGNAVVDILSFVDEKFLSENQITKGIMTLIDEPTAENLYSKAGKSVQISGGCAANTVSAIASLGGKTAYFGRVKNDQLGKVFMRDLRETGVYTPSIPAETGKATARCFIYVTPDADRSMLPYLGACTEFDESYVDEETIKKSKVVYIEGYLWDADEAKIKAIKKVISLAKKHGTKVSFSLSDPFCVSRHRAAFLKLLNEIDILFCNEEEAKSLFETNDLGAAIEKISELCDIASITTGAKGSIVIYDNSVKNVAAAKIAKLLDTTGAGDLYASGFLYAYTAGKSFEQCAQLGNKCAAAIIQQLGARPAKPLKDTIAA